MSGNWVNRSSHSAPSTPISFIQYNTVKIDGTHSDVINLNLSTSINGTTNYSNPFISKDFKSLQRNELYRYGIVFYDADGNKSVTKWIADIRIPSQYESGFGIFTVDTTSGVNFNTSSALKGLITHPIGIEFKVKTLPEGAVAYQIVRCKRSISDRATLTQCVLSIAMTRRNNTYCGNTDNYLSPSCILTSGLYIL